MAEIAPRRTAQFVVKATKHCNLRCNYCYEYKELGNKQRMQLDSLRGMFVNVRDHALTHGFESLDFVWHGGEPFMLPLDYYQALQLMQKEVFTGDLEVTNVVQSNLTVLTDRHIEFLKNSGFFRGIGVSFDVYGDQRVDTSGKLRTDTILKNIQRLIEERIKFGAITVLARNTLPHARSIYKFWDKMGIQFRFLPFYMSAFDNQVVEHALTNEEIVAALTDIFHDWMASERATSVDPIAEYVGYAANSLTSAPRRHYHKMQQEVVFLVNLDGGVWGVGDAYDSAKRYGNMFSESFTAILDSAARRAIVAQSDERVARHCGPCPHYGHCPGAFVADATPEQAAALERSGCLVRVMLDRMTATLEQTDVGQALMAGGIEQIDNQALKIAL